MVKMGNLPDDSGEGRTITGANWEVTAQQPNGQAARPLEERPQARPVAGAPAREAAAESPRDRVKLVFGVKIRLENRDGSLKPGMPADAEILVGEPAEQAGR